MAAADDIAPLVEWAERIDVSTPLSFITSHNHLTINAEVTCLWGDLKDRNSC